METHASVRISSSGAVTASAEQDSARAGGSDLGGVLVGEPAMVSLSALPADRPSSGPSSGQGLAVPGEGAASQSSTLPPSRLEIVRRRKEAEGFSEGVATRMAQAQRKSSRVVYESKWQAFRAWCDERGVDSLNPSLAEVSEFLNSLFAKGLSVSTIRGYRSAISATVISKEGINVGQDASISLLLRNFSINRPVQAKRAPLWNLALVLRILREPPFEPIMKAGLRELTWKVAFLIALASGRRRSEVHALSGDPDHVRFTRGSKQVSLYFVADFMPKNLRPDEPQGFIVIPSLSQEVGRDDEERLLCPIRALCAYRNRTAMLREGKRNLFISYQQGFVGDIKPSTLSRWISEVIRYAYEKAGDAQLRENKVTAHEVRALANSWALFNGVPMTEVLRAGFWHAESTFTKYYLRDLCGQSDDLYALGPLVTAQTVVQQQQ